MMPAARVAGSRSTAVTASSSPAAAAAGDRFSSAAISSAAKPAPAGPSEAEASEAEASEAAEVRRRAANRACARMSIASTRARSRTSTVITVRQPSASQASSAGRPADTQQPTPTPAAAGAPAAAAPPSAVPPQGGTGGKVPATEPDATTSESNIRTNIAFYPDISTIPGWAIPRSLRKYAGLGRVRSRLCRPPFPQIAAGIRCPASGAL